jgi:AbrB family looped-hinge helix DNA binding protein
MVAMMVSIDRAGRVVIPKDVRDRLSLDADSELEIETEGDVIRLVPVRRRGRAVVDADDGWPVIQRGEGPAITDADVRRWRDVDQR